MATPPKKPKTSYVCSECGASQPKWAGQCPDCGAWNSLNEQLAPARPAAARGGGYAGLAGGAVVETLAEVAPEERARTACGIGELDRVLGGGLVGGSVILLGGDPGIGKSTLLLQACAALASSRRVLYVSGEESPQQISLRARRLGLDGEDIRLLPETCVERILYHAAAEQPRVMVVDSIQTLFTEQLQSAPGSVSQVRESAAQLVRFAKQRDTVVFLVGHVTKEGALAGPRVLEHMVDTVLYFEGESGGAFRLVRSIKNRFGAVNELGVFLMGDQGLREVKNPSAIFLSRHDEPTPGSLVMVTREGTRPLLVEVQALVDESSLANPRRVALGLDQNRLSMLLAVLHRHGGIGMFNQDVFVNVVGGVRIGETAADLPVLMAVLSSYRDRPLPLELAVFGEVGLSGEVRPVPNGPDRLREAVKHGLRRVIAPAGNVPKGGVEGLEIVAVRTLSEALDAL
ncbi:DNA repair protein RadA [Marichromatium gracile]|uniref:DNA repair protein RadA n=1 Tax=Marichromatium gracile TaxID=1048 RepID=A0A4R4ADB6_MARGR|nr:MULTISPECIES: DNA repair protein RadA [Marichromatium]MBO8086620.1 DNA repair protein RadA [Marichromatium sp.]MBK1709721.1 DNA repair protein RadA [Marichromatium gracile]MCF1182607.1 DNA repair protein RadA [Marichromatium gracile]RNE91484.1 DNA repair protein RadA [Marichromatium sp. AB31]RNE91733.1 DNA repair protein RadA [Marichromatium sp. AB32]